MGCASGSSSFVLLLVVGVGEGSTTAPLKINGFGGGGEMGGGGGEAKRAPRLQSIVFYSIFELSQTVRRENKNKIGVLSQTVRRETKIILGVLICLFGCVFEVCPGI